MRSNMVKAAQKCIDYVSSMPEEVANKLQFLMLDATQLSERASYLITGKT